MASASPFCVLLALISGCAVTLSAVVVAYPAQRAVRTDVPQSQTSKHISVLSNLIFVGVGIGLNMVAVKFGPVAIVTPVSTGANLLSNMLLQSALGIARYSQNAVVGTLVLASAVTMLVQVGPRDIDPTEPVLELVCNPMSLVFLSSLLVGMMASMYVILQQVVRRNIILVFLYCLVGAGSTVINVALTKLVQMDVSIFAKVPMVILYLILAVVGLVSNVVANRELEDPSLFTPVGAGVTLVLTCLAGLFVWGDGARLDNFVLSYATIYVLVVLGSYLVSSNDLLGVANQNVAEAHVSAGLILSGKSPDVRRGRAQTFAYSSGPLLKATDTSFTPSNSLVSTGGSRKSSVLDSYTEANLHPAAPRGALARAWAERLTVYSQAGAMNPLHSEETLRLRLEDAIIEEEIQPEDLIELVLKLLQDRDMPGQLSSPALLRWLSKNLRDGQEDGDISRQSSSETPGLSKRRSRTLSAQQTILEEALLPKRHTITST